MTKFCVLDVKIPPASDEDATEMWIDHAHYALARALDHYGESACTSARESKTLGFPVKFPNAYPVSGWSNLQEVKAKVLSEGYEDVGKFVKAKGTEIRAEVDKVKNGHCPALTRFLPVFVSIKN